jgi:DNA invertase Pin-like site-specific DNA recombinase
MDLGYARVSTVEQNLDLQWDALNQVGVAQIYEDKLSGANYDRPQLEACLTRLRKGDTLIVWKLDRLARSTLETVSIVLDLVERGVNFRSLTDHIDLASDSSFARFQLTLLAAIAELERNIIIERTKAGREAARARGKFVGAPRLYGWLPDRSAVVPEEAEVLAEVTERILNGESVGSIVKDLNARAIPSTTGKHWRSNTLRQVMENPNLAPIIGQDESDRLRRIFSDPSRKRQGVPAKHLLSGIVRCKCKAKMYVTSRGADGKPRYRCFHNTAVGNCGKTQVAAHLLEEYVTKELIRWLAGPGLVVVRNRLMQLDRDFTLTAQKLHADEQELVELAKLKGEGRYTTPEWLALRDPIEARIKAARELLDKQPALLALTNIPKTRAELEAAWPTWDMERKRSILKAAIARLRVTPTASRGPGHFDEERVQLMFVSDHPAFGRIWATEEENSGLLHQVATELHQDGPASQSEPR